MKVIQNPECNLTVEEIEIAIKEFINKRIQEEIDHKNTKIKFKLVDIASEDDRGPYSPQYVLAEANVQLKYLI